jgi:hypothetical protein
MTPNEEAMIKDSDNRMQTQLVIATGPADDLRHFQATHFVPFKLNFRHFAEEGRFFDLRSIVDIPSELIARQEMALEEASKEEGDDGPLLAAADAVSDEIFDWKVNNWGIEENTRTLNVMQPSPNVLVFSFKTDYSGPAVALDKLRKMYPSLQFEFRLYDPAAVDDE